MEEKTIQMRPMEAEFDKAFSKRHGLEIQRKLKATRIAVFGLGGLGSHTTFYLARMGVGYLHLIDFDRVEFDNLHRQQYRLCHVGEYKTEALASQLREINPYIQLKLESVQVNRENVLALIADSDLICEAFDDPEAKAMLVNAVLEWAPEKQIIASSGMAGLDSGNTVITRKVSKNFYLCGDGVSEGHHGNGLMAARVGICAGHQALTAVRLALELEK
ncbi:thiamine biosynthesis protein ThiF [Hominifimenecus sp. rT4P-3]|uniref:thiamine biosynthesis protein ThiF n=1 Tax=Hominifimenecus sp. rT4P-3 TaxID=3242979 RepID=UPI003DA59C4C